MLIPLPLHTDHQWQGVVSDQLPVPVHGNHVLLPGQRNHCSTDDSSDYSPLRSYGLKSSADPHVDGHLLEHRWHIDSSGR